MAFSVGGMKSHSLLCQGKWRPRKSYQSGIKGYRGNRCLHACGGFKTMSCFIAVPSLNTIPFVQCFGPFPGTGEKSMELNRKKSSYIDRYGAAIASLFTEKCGSIVGYSDSGRCITVLGGNTIIGSFLPSFSAVPHKQRCFLLSYRKQGRLGIFWGVWHGRIHEWILPLIKAGQCC